VASLGLRPGVWMALIVSVPLHAETDEGPAIAGVTAVDSHPQACVSCHIDMVDAGIDARFSTALRQWSVAAPDELVVVARATMPGGAKLTGKHPPASESLMDIPAACISCHATASGTAPPFARLMHLVHYTGEENHFLTIFAGQCVLCHKLNRNTGEWTVPSGPERLD